MSNEIIHVETAQLLADLSRQHIIQKAIDDLEAIEVNSKHPWGACDPESAHVDADGVLLAFVPDEVRDAYERVRARCGGFWYA